MNKYVYPPCNSSLATSFVFKILSKTEEVGITSLFGGSVASDEGVYGGSAVPNLQFVPDLNVVVREGEECVRRALEELAASAGRAEEANEAIASWTSLAV